MLQFYLKYDKREQWFEENQSRMTVIKISLIFCFVSFYSSSFVSFSFQFHSFYFRFALAKFSFFYLLQLHFNSLVCNEMTGTKTIMINKKKSILKKKKVIYHSSCILFGIIFLSFVNQWNKIVFFFYFKPLWKIGWPI